MRDEIKKAANKYALLSAPANFIDAAGAAFLAGAAWQRGQDAKLCDRECEEYQKSMEEFDRRGDSRMGTNEARCAVTAQFLAERIRAQSSDDPARCSCPQAQPRADMPFCMLCKRMLRAPTGEDSNEKQS